MNGAVHTIQFTGGAGGKIAGIINEEGEKMSCLLYTSDAADERSSVDLGGRRIIKKKKSIDSRRANGHKTTQ